MAGYEDKFDKIMDFGEWKMHAKGEKKTIRNEEDLRAFFQRLDDERRDQKSAPKFSTSFIDKLINTQGARELIQEKQTLGRFDAPKAPLPRKASMYRDRGLPVNAYGDRYAVRYDRGNRSFYRDTENGRFVSKQRFAKST